MSNTNNCHDCNCSPGEFHSLGCDMEQCPFCGGQLISCDCCYEKLGLFDEEKYTLETDYLPPKIYTEGMTKKQEKQWEDILIEKGRIPYRSENN